MSYMARGTTGGPYIYGDDENMRFYNLPGQRDTTIPQAIFDQVAVIRVAEMIEDGSLENVIQQGQTADGVGNDRRWNWVRETLLSLQ